MKKLLTSLAICAAAVQVAKADVGMWIPSLIGKNIDEMQRLGLKLSAEDIYSINHESLKDAVVIFGGGCTGEIVSEDGLLLTNHHCGFDYIQSHSSVEHNYLANGFWAMNRADELPNKDLSISLLNYIEDVTDSILIGTDTIASAERYKEVITERRNDLVKRHSDDKFQKAEVEEFYGGNQYLLFVYTEFRDVRLVGAPPSEIGKFGGDTDNWVWPRHTGDFSIFRIYADKDNNPAEYAADNVPYHPKKHLTISTKGVQEGDFAMVLGYPGSTNLYAPSCDIEDVQNSYNPQMVEIRTAKLEVMNRHQAKSEKVNIQYAAKNAHTSNAWKKWQGEVKGLKKTDALQKKRDFEAELRHKSAICDTLLNEYEKYYQASNTSETNVVWGYWSEIVRRGGVEILEAPYEYWGSDESKAVKPEVSLKDFDYNLSVEMAGEVWNVYCKNIARKYWPASMLKWKGTPQEYMRKMYQKSAFTDSVKMAKLLSGKNWQKKLRNDPAYKFVDEMFAVRDALREDIRKVERPAVINNFERKYIKAMREAYPDSIFPADANFTMRISYGNVAGYEADDAVRYNYYTTLDGIIEKNRTGNPDYTVPQRLIDLYKQKAFAPYADAKDGKLHTAFVSTCHTTGGNSGSPVLNANGELIGLNFDRAWNGVMSDMSYDASICRNITLDIRYLLFIVDKYAGAEHLIKEMLK